MSRKKIIKRIFRKAASLFSGKKNQSLEFIFISYQYHRDIKNKWKSNRSSQLRYRLTPSLKLGIELYRSENTFDLALASLWALNDLNETR